MLELHSFADGDSISNLIKFIRNNINVYNYNYKFVVIHIIRIYMISLIRT
jgi:hypothetical protein